MSPPTYFSRPLIFHLVDDLGKEDWAIECLHNEFDDVLREAILGLEEELAPRKLKLSRIERDD